MAEAKRRIWIVASLIAVVVMLVGVGVWWTQRDRSESSNDAQARDEAGSIDRDELLRRKRAERAELGSLERVRVGGRVTRADDGTGIAGATVLLSRKDLIQGQAPRPGEPTSPLTATTDANGGWQIPAVDPGRYMISATAVGFVPATNNDVRITGRGEQASIDLALAPGGALLSGTITDIGGGPIEGVLVRLQDSSQINFGFNRAPLAAITNDEGQYRLQVATGRYSISTFHSDYVTEGRLTDIPAGGRREDFKLIPGGTIEGVVLAQPDGKPIAGARVTFSDSRSGDGFGIGESNLSVDGSVVVSDEEGRFRITGLRAGVVSLVARAAGHASVTPEEVAIGIGEQVGGVELWVDTAYTISGYVVPRGEPEGAIEGVLVGAWQMQPFGLLVANAPSANDGYFEIVGVRPGNWQVGAVGEEHLLALTGATATVVDQDVGDLLVELDTGIYVRGRVDPGTRARVNVEINPDDVSLGNIAGTMSDALAGTVADENGEFELGPLGPGAGFGGRELKIIAQSDEGFRGEAVVQLRREDIEGVVVSMQKGASVSGTVLDTLGVPQSGVTVSITPVDPKPRANVINFGGGSDQAPTSEDGRFSVRGLELGKHDVVVKDSKGRPMSWAEGTGPEPKQGADADEVPPLEIDIGDTVNEQFLDLRVVPRDAEITGVVLDAEGLPVADAWVRASLDIDPSQMWRRPGRDQTEHVTGVVPEDDGPKGPNWARSTFYSEPPVLTDQNGFFVIKELRRDRNYHLVAEGERGGARATLESVAPNSRVTLTLEQLSGIDGVVTLDGKPVAEYQVELVGPTRREKRVAHPQGQFRLDRLDPGKYEVRVSADAGTGEAEVELAEAGRAKVTVELERAGTLRGRVVGDKDGEPIAGLRIMVMSAGRMDPGAGLGMLTGQGPKTDREGRFEVSKVAPGKGTIEFLDPDAGLAGSATVAEIEFELEPGADQDLGDIKGVQGDRIPNEERGSLQMRWRQTTWAKRPRPPGTDLEAEQPDEEAEADPSTRLWVWSVEVGGVAEQAGVTPGDEIVTIDGQSVASLGVPMAANLLSPSRLRVGQDVRLELARDGDRIDVTLKAARTD
ncbi:MAG TPA: carboxypeptidase regulatory-like domain-containing protein [Enhygromyxa sp.]|nr:carboxypeptidase regulatory-like domain-containing protein [Enhygromyxa sp.]